MAAIKRVKGMYDIVPENTPRWQWVERTALETLGSYGYQELRLPILEQTDLFARAMGASTDVVSKEMYAFTDRNGDQLALRPEGTAGTVRAAIQNGLLHGHLARVWYSGPMFRRENVQRGRNRQFYQIGAEAFGQAGPDIDGEQIAMLARLWARLGLRRLRLEINSLGTPESRASYREQLVAYLSDHRDALDEDSLKRLDSNPLRILDSKNPSLAEIIGAAPSLLEALDPESREHLDAVQQVLVDLGIPHVVNPRLVRGLDYYSRTVFEWITDELGAQGTICAGGRYDGLVQAQGGPATPGIGFAMGVDRIVELTTVQELAVPSSPPDAYLVLAGDAAAAAGVQLAEQFRSAIPGLTLECNMGKGSFKAQFKRADRSGAGIALVVGEDELATGKITLKFLRDDRPQETLDRNAALERVAKLAGCARASD